MFPLNNKRYISETGQEQRVASIVEPVARDLGFFLVRVKILPENGCTLQIMAEDEAGHFSITQCQELSQELSPVLDVEEPIDVPYHLEVSSPGVDRPLVRARDFERNVGHEARIELAHMINGRKRFRGIIKGVENDAVTLTLPDVPAGATPDFVLPLSDISSAKLILTDHLLAQARAQQKNDQTLLDESVQHEIDQPASKQEINTTQTSKETN
ncbi:MAG: ribosome maturation factor RimP [Devosiaceae bacterium]|nr:ribosome maturation factor RimP [Devosiaceae bacterium]